MIIIVKVNIKKMKTRSNYDEEDLMLDRMNTWTKRRNKMIQKILLDKREKTAYKNEQNKITENFALKMPGQTSIKKITKIERKEIAGSVICPITTK